MSQYDNPYQSGYAVPQFAAQAQESERAGFIRRTYLHLAGAIGAFVILEAVIFTLIPDAAMANMLRLIAGSRFGWFVVLGAFMGVSWLAQSWARSSTSLSTQYAGLGLYVVAEAVLFVPLLFVAGRYVPNAIPTAALMTGVIFGGLTAAVFVTRVNLSWLGRYLCWAGFAALGIILCGMLFGFSLGLFFIGGMIALASGYILYDTSNVVHQYRTDQHVAAALALFASVALLFWYVLQLVMRLSSRD